jgi:hypothetical protein
MTFYATLVYCPINMSKFISLDNPIFEEDEMRKTLALVLSVVVILTLVLVACSPTPPPPPAPCVDFSGYPDDTNFGNPFWLPPNANGYKFTGVAGVPFINVSGNVVGLQFAEGLEVDLPGPVSSVTLDVASFSKEIDVYAIDSTNQAVANVLVPTDNLVHNIQLSGTDIVKIMLKGGGGEGILVKICS